jgi:TfoX/Sxy family transcriptional regulator of competence genes
MAYDETLAARIRKLLAGRKRVTERKMFGGLAFMLRGRMCCGVLNDELVIRVGPDRYEDAVAKPHARPMDFTGRPIKGFVYVRSKGLRDRQALKKWIDHGVRYAMSLPVKRSRKP